MNAMIYLISASHFCPVDRLPSLISDNRIVDFLWLTSNYFIIVYSNSSGLPKFANMTFANWTLASVESPKMYWRE